MTKNASTTACLVTALLGGAALLAPLSGCSSDQGDPLANGGSTSAGSGADAAGRGGAAHAAGSGTSGGVGAAGGVTGVAGAGGSDSLSGAAGVATTGGGAGAPVGGAAGAAAAGAAGSPAGATNGGSSSETGSATFSIEVELASDVDAKAPGTVGIVTWTVDVASLVEAQVEFGLDTSYGTSAPVDLALSDHRTLLLGMKPARTYHFRVVAKDASKTFTSEDHTLETGPATTLVPLASFSSKDEAKRRRGFIISSYWQGDGAGMAFILDADGAVVWWYPDGPATIARARPSADGKNMWLSSADNSGAPLVRVSMDTLDAQTYMNAVSSHDLTPVSGATMAYLEYGENDCNSIFEIEPSGATHEVFESQGVVQASGCHGNALRYSQAEDVYTFSDVSQDIFALSRAGEVLWKLSERVDMGNDAWGGVQHGHQLLANSIVIFANRGGGMNSSAAVEYDLESGAELLNFVSGDFSQNLGDVQRLPGGNTLVTYSNDSIIKEIDSQKNVVLEIDGGGSRFGYALWTESLYGAPPDILD